MRPFYRNAQPGITASPTTRTYQYIMLAFIKELSVQLFDFVGNGRIVPCIVSFRLHIYQIMDIFHNAVSQRIEALQQHFILWNQIQVFRQIGFYIHHRSHLKQVEHSTLRLGIQSNGKLNFHGSGHFTLAIFLRQLQNLRQREHLMLKDIGEGNDLTASRINTVPNHHIIRIVCRGNVLQSSILISLLHWKLQQIESIVQRKVFTLILQVKRIELCLGFTQGNFHFTGLKHLSRMIRTDTQGQSTIHNILAQTQCKTDGSLLSLFITNRIIVQRTGHT